jgi:apolipoprotein D and lipocalin family protein
MRFFILFSLLLAAGCSQPPVNRNSDTPLATVAAVDTGRYLGRWYEFARLPNSFEKDCEGVTADYSMREDGMISVVNTCRIGAPDGEIKRAKGKARIIDTETNARLEVSFFGPFYGDYWIIHLADDYSLSIVGEPEGRYLWILTREPTINDDARAEAMSVLTSFGYDISQLHFTLQPPVPENP